MGLRCIIFDLDGTLLDTRKVIISSLVRTVKEFVGRPPTKREMRLLFGRTLIDQMSYYCPERAEEMVRFYVEHNLKQHPRLVKPFPGAEDVLGELRSLGCKLAILTSKQRESAEYGLGLFGLDRHFDEVVCAEDVRLPKPHPEGVFRALESCGVPPSDAMVAGDNVCDIEAGKAAGTVTAACLYGMGDRAELQAAAPDFMIEDIREVVDIARISPRELPRGS